MEAGKRVKSGETCIRESDGRRTISGTRKKNAKMVKKPIIDELDHP